MALILFMCGLILIPILMNASHQPYTPSDSTGSTTPTVNIEVDKVGTVTRIIDGDSFETSVGEVRLADIDCPEYYEAGYDEATAVLRGTINDKFLYLDVDDVSQTDQYERWVCVAYVRYNTTHVLNVNAYLLARGVAVIDNYANEFSPSSWTLYNYYP